VALLAVLSGAARPEEYPMADAMVNAHNAVRARFGVPPLKWSDKLAAFAQEWADTLLITGEFEHRKKSPYGENLFTISGTTANPGHVVNDWAAEVRIYDYRTNSCRGDGECGHYTQIVWKTTKEVGCAMAGAGGREVWVCNYSPRGNWIGQRPY
jgi:uncharacterized protein YkwD